MSDAKKIDIKSFFQKLKNLKKITFDSEALKIITLIFCALILLLLLLPYFFNLASLKPEITQKVNQISGGNFSINGEVRIEMVPFPAIILRDVVLQNYKSKSGRIYNLYAKSAKIRLKLSEFPDRLLIKKIIFSNAVINSYYSNSAPVERKDKFSENLAKFKDSSGNAPEQKLPIAQEETSSNKASWMLSIADVKESSFTSTNFIETEFKDSEAIFYDHFERKREVSEINAKMRITAKEIFAKGSLNSENVVSDFKLLAKFNQKPDQQNSSLDIFSPALRMQIKGNFSGSSQGIFTAFKGTISAEILDLKSFYKSYVSPTSLLPDKIKSETGPIKITANISNEVGEVIFSDLLIDSVLVNGKGDVDLNFSEKITFIDVNLDLENLDLDRIWSGEPFKISGTEDELSNPEKSDNDLPETLLVNQLEKKEVSEATITSDENNSEIKKTVSDVPLKVEANSFAQNASSFAKNEIKNLDLLAQITAKKIKYLGGELKEFSAYAIVSKNDQILLMPIVFKMAGDSLFRINGAVYDNANSVKFVGKIDAKGKSLGEVFRWLQIESPSLKIDNFKNYRLYSDVILVPNKTNLSRIYLGLNDYEIELKGDLKIDSSSSKTPRIEGNIKIGNLKLEDYFLTPKQNTYFSPGLLIKKLLWLNNISSEAELNLGFDSASYKEKKFLEQSFGLKVRRGYFEITNLNSKLDQANIKGSLLVDISEKNPRFEMSLAVDNLQFQVGRDSKENLFDQFFNLPSLEGFNGKVAMDFDSIKLNDLPVTNTKILGKLIDGDLRELILGSDLYGGHLDYKGMIGIRIAKTINGNFSLDNVDLKPLLSDLAGIDKISGISNISASITSVAQNRKEFLTKLNSEIKFNTNSPSVENYGLNDLVIKMFAPKINFEQLRNPEKILFNSQASTTFKEASGTIKFNGEKDGRVDIKASSTAINAILSGSITDPNDKVDLLFNVIFLTGTRQKQIPINIVTNLKGETKNLSQKTNLDQVRQYLGLPKINVSSPIKESDQKDDQKDKISKNIEKTILLQPTSSIENQTQKLQP